MCLLEDNFRVYSPTFKMAWEIKLSLPPFMYQAISLAICFNFFRDIYSWMFCYLSVPSCSKKYFISPLIKHFHWPHLPKQVYDQYTN